MKKGILWIFGDSYGTFHRPGDELKDWHWMWNLADKLNHKNFYNICEDGVANEWIYFQLMQNSDKITEDDTVIFITTQFNRQWFFPGNDGVGNIMIPNLSNYVKKEEAVAIDFYLKYLTDNPQNHIRFQWLLYALNFLKNNKIKLFIVPGFENEGFDFGAKITGSLFDVCYKEAKGKTFDNWAKWIKSQGGKDPRESHISKCNHPVLAEKLYQTIVNDNDLDFSTGFKQDFLI